MDTRNSTARIILLLLTTISVIGVSASFVSSYYSGRHRDPNTPAAAVPKLQQSSIDSGQQPIMTISGPNKIAQAYAPFPPVQIDASPPPLPSPQLHASSVAPSSFSPQPLPPQPLPPPLLPLPLRASPALPSASPMSALLVTWEAHPGRNCWWGGNGAGLELESPRGSVAPGVDSLDGCKAACVAKIPECEGFLLTKRNECYRKGAIVLDSCGSSSDMTLYLIVPPSPPAPPSPPPSPPYRPFSSGVLAINERFRNGRPSDRLDEVGLLLHQWDGLEAHDIGKPWQMCLFNCMCQGTFINGRVSAMAVYRDLNQRADRVAIPLPFGNRGGLILDPSYATVDCIYGIDGATYHLDNPSHPGCTDTLCNTYSNPFPCGFGGGYVEAWGPQDLKLVLETYAEHGVHYHAPGFHSGYNEFIVNSPRLNENLPQAIMGFFFPKGQSTVTSDLGFGIMVDVVSAHAAFLNEYQLTNEQVPLLVLDAANWESPFSPYHDK